MPDLRTTVPLSQLPDFDMTAVVLADRIVETSASRRNHRRCCVLKLIRESCH